MRRVSRFSLLAAWLMGWLIPVQGFPQEAALPSLPEAVTGLQRVLVDVVARSEKSVVAISRAEKDRPGEALNLEFRPDPFGRRPFPLAVSKPTDPDFVPREYGAGVVIDRRGLVLTAYHVLGADGDYYVTTQDRKVFRATVKGADPRSDLAVLAIEATDLTPIRFGDAAGLRKGQIVVALGNPYAIARDGQVSASWGIVANLGRKAPAVPADSDPVGKTTLHHFGTLIQTDAKVTLGTSGGPLLNLKGEMIGLMTALAAAPGYEQAAGYAFPVDETFRRAVERLKEGREVEYGFLGIRPDKVTQEESSRGIQGTRVERVVPGTPAFRHGLRMGDVISKVNGQPIYDADGLMLEVGKLPVESVVRLAVLRDGRRSDIEVPLGKYPVRGKKIITTPAPSWRGLRVDYATAAPELDSRSDYALPLSDMAVVISDVEKGSPAWVAGLRPGTFIGQVDRRPVRTPKDFHAAVAGKAGPVQLGLVGGRSEEAIRVVPPGS